MRPLALPLAMAAALAASPLSAKVLPVLNNPAVVQVTVGDASTTVALNHVFGMEPVDDDAVRFTTGFTSGGNPLFIDIALFSNRTPLSRANFLNYVNDGDYDSSLLHRSEPGFVLQGGSYTYDTTTSAIGIVPRDPPVPNEPGISNSAATVSIPKRANEPNGGSSGFFINMGENGPQLDGQNGGFTVFGRVTRSTFPVAQIFQSSNNFTIWDFSIFLGGDFDTVPVFNSYTDPPPPLPDETTYIILQSAFLTPLSAFDAGDDTTLGYGLLGNTDTSLVNAILSGDVLELFFAPDTTGSALVTTGAIDSVGNVVGNRIPVIITDTYARWRAANFSGPDLTNDAVSGPLADPNGDGVTNLELFASKRDATPDSVPSSAQFIDFKDPGGDRFARFEVTRRVNVPVTFSVEKSTDLKSWDDAPFSTLGTSRPGDIDVIVHSIQVDDPVSYPCHYRVRWDLAAP